MREKEVEQSLRKAVLQRDGLCLKFISPSWSGAPDRLVLLPKGKMGFVETKAPGKKLRPLQQARMRNLRKLGFTVVCLDEKDKIDEVLDKIEEGEM